MAKLLDLAAELILAIAFHNPRSADKLHFILVSRYMHGILIPQLYKYILLDQSGDPSKRGDFTHMNGGSSWDTVRLCRLTSVLKDTSSSHKRAVKSLSLELDSDTIHHSFDCSGIMLALRHHASLKSLCLSSKRSAGRERGQTTFVFSPKVLGQSLRPVRETLEILIIDIDQDISLRTGRRIGTFGSFTALNYLSIQSHVFFGDRDAPYHHTQIGNVNIGLDMSSLASFLSPRLQKLQMTCWTDGEKENKHYWGRLIAAQLEFLMSSDLGEWLLDLRDIIMYYPAKDCSPNDAAERLTLKAGEQDLETNKSECIRYAAEERWQELGKILTEMASREKRSISVKFEQASQKECPI